MSIPRRLLLAIPSSELRSYTQEILDDLGIHDVSSCASTDEALELLAQALAKQIPFDLLLCQHEGCVDAARLTATLDVKRVCVITRESAPENLVIVSRIGLERVIFRPFGHQEIAALLRA